MAKEITIKKKVYKRLVCIASEAPTVLDAYKTLNDKHNQLMMSSTLKSAQLGTTWAALKSTVAENNNLKLILRNLRIEKEQLLNEVNRLQSLNNTLSSLMGGAEFAGPDTKPNPETTSGVKAVNTDGCQTQTISKETPGATNGTAVGSVQEDLKATCLGSHLE